MTIDERLEALTMNVELMLAAQAKTERSLRRWAALDVKEARKHRKRQQDLELSITQVLETQRIIGERMKELTETQLHTDQRMDALILTVDEIVRGRNGGPKIPQV